MRFLEDFDVGEEAEIGSCVLSEAEIIRFARVYDPQPMHLDAGSAQAAMMGGLIASGWHSAAMSTRLLAEHVLVPAGTAQGAPGIRKLEWREPVRPGDRLAYRFEILGRRASKSRRDRGLVHLRIHAANQQGRDVLMLEHSVMILRRDASAPVPAPEGEDFTAPPPDDLHLSAGPNPPLARVGEMVPGSTRVYGSMDFDVENIIAFAGDYDPQPFHLSEEAGRASAFGSLSASGWQTAAGWMRAVTSHWAEIRARGEFMPRTGPSPGFRDLVWHQPVRPGDRITYGSRLIEARKSASRPGWGIVSNRNFGMNQRGELVMAFTGAVLWEAVP